MALDKPPSRFFACLFSGSLFALLWTYKIKKTRKWPLLVSIELLVLLVGGIIDVSAGTEFTFTTVMILLGITTIIRVHRMYKWITEYNLGIYGYKSAGALYKARLQKQNAEKTAFSFTTAQEKPKQRPTENTSTKFASKPSEHSSPTYKLFQKSQDSSSYNDTSKKVSRPNTTPTITTKEKTPKNAPAFVEKGTSLYNLNRHQEAIQCYDAAIKLDPKHTRTYIQKGESLTQLGRYEEALQCYNKAKNLESKHTRNYYYPDDDNDNTQKHTLLDDSVSLHKTNSRTTIQQNRNIDIILEKQTFTESQLYEYFEVRNSGGIRPSRKNKLIILITSTYYETGYKDTKDSKSGFISYTGEGQGNQEFIRNNKSILEARARGYLMFYFEKRGGILFFRHIVEYYSHSWETQPNIHGISRKVINFQLKIIV